MSITLHPPTTAGLSAEELLAWRTVPVSVAVDLEPAAQVDPALRAVTRPDLPLALIGPALTIACTPPDFGAVVKALDEARPGQVVVIDAGGHLNHAVIGEILGGHLRAKGCAGLVVDGAVRDIAELGSWSDFPVFARSINPRGPTSAQHGAINAAVTLGGVSVESGDLIIGDRDGLAVLSPKVARRLLADAQAKLTLEAEWIEGLASGQSAAEIFGV
jgi:4-hydroxy-4-methyl-2-oxoglutarate aldolase